MRSPDVNTTAAPPSPPAAFLTLPAPGKRDFVIVRNKVRLLAARILLSGDFREPVSRATRQALASIQPHLTEILRRDPERLLAAVSSVDVLPFLLGAHGGAIAADASVPKAVPNMLAQMAENGAVIDTIVWPLPFAEIVTDRGLWTFDPPARSMAVQPSAIYVETAAGTVSNLSDTPPVPVRLPFATVPAATSFGLHDTNPFMLEEAHPDKSGNALSLGGRPANDWITAIDEAFALIRTGIPDWFAEMPDALTRIVPVGFEQEKHLSASYREAPGLVYITLHPDPLTMAEAIVHETEHTKLNALSWLDPVLLNGDSCWTKSPVRPDLRPLMGVLLAAHAFVPVAAMHHGLAAAGHAITQSSRFRERREQVLRTNGEALQTVRAHGKPTELGARLIDDLVRLHEFSVAAFQRVSA